VLNSAFIFSIVLLEGLITGISAVGILATSSGDKIDSCSAEGTSSTSPSFSVTLSVNSARASNSLEMVEIVPSVKILNPFLRTTSFTGSLIFRWGSVLYSTSPSQAI